MKNLLSIDKIPELLIQKQIEDDHDTECALKAGELIELGFMGQEFACYGFAYIEQNVIKYFICDREQTMTVFQKNCFMKGYTPTDILYRAERFHVPVGKNDFFKKIVRRHTAKQLKELYGRTYFQAIHDCCQTAVEVDIAWPNLNKLCNQLRNSLDSSIVQIVRGLAEDQYKMRKLTKEHYEIVQKWAEKEFYNSAESAYEEKQYRRTYYGFCSSQGGQRRYYVNASLFTVEQKKREKISNGEIVTPIIQKTFTDNDYIALLTYKDVFLKILERYFTDDFMVGLAKLWCLPSGVNKVLYQTYLKKIKKEESINACKDFYYYGNLWNTL